MRIQQLASHRNLELAWRRITTGGNQSYKRFFRHTYYAYEVALEENLADLRERLLGGSYQPRSPERVYVPKKSGLHRPLSLLYLEDQIVLQAFANLAARKVQPRRQPLQFKTVFSNLLQRHDSIFFFRRWQETYAAFQEKVEKLFSGGMTWVADFDLAAFYDTISHELLLKCLYPRTANADLEWFRKDCLQTWTSTKASSSHGHGLPQGPIASDFLAECFLLPVDNSLKDLPGYVRYVDDVRLLGASENDVRRAVIRLENQCHERGLIPQSGKFAIKKAKSLDDALGMLPSIADPQRASGRAPISPARARKLFEEAIGGKPYRVTDKTRLRYVLYRARPQPRILSLVLRLLPHHPEHADAFFAYLAHYDFRMPIYRLCRNLVATNPYPYVRGEAWHVLARYVAAPNRFPGNDLAQLTTRAIEISKGRRSGCFVETWGACHFLAASEKAGVARLSRWLQYQGHLTQALLAPVLPDSALAPGELGQRYLERSSFEPGLSICGRLHALGRTPGNLGVRTSKLQSQVQNTLRALGVLNLPASPIDPLREIMAKRYSIRGNKSWRRLLGAEYVHALGILKQAEAAFYPGASEWLAHQNSFNHAVFLALQVHLNATSAPGAVRTRDRNGQIINFGTLLQAAQPFSQAHPNLGAVFRDVNARRNRLPGSHPYEKRSAQRAEWLKAQERNQLVGRLKTAYADLAGLMP